MKLFNKMSIANLALKTKIQLLLIICILLISSVSFIGIHFITKANNFALHNSVSNTLAYSATNISNHFDTINSLASLVASDDVIQKQMSALSLAKTKSEKSISTNQVYTTICNYLFNSDIDEIEYVSIFQRSSMISTSSQKTHLLSEEIIQDLIQKSSSASGASLLVTDYSDKYGLFLVKDLRQIKNLSLNYLGTLIIQINLDELIASATSYTTGYDNTSYLLFRENSCIYNNSSLKESDLAYLKQQLLPEYSILHINRTNYFIVYKFLPISNLTYVCIVPYGSIMNTIMLTLNGSIIALVFCLLMIILGSRKLIDALTRHFALLLDKMNKFGEGIYEPQNSISAYKHRTDEIAMLHNNFDSMVQKVNTLIQQNYVNEILTKEAQLKAMENQINPHFLYNTLNSICWRAKSIGASDISEMTIALGNLLRTALSKNTVYTLKEEICVLDNYITIQKLRYGDRLDYSMELPPSLLDCEIPKFTIQPLLENAIRYALEAITETCHITITGIQVEKGITIKVKNNGSKFESNLINKLEAGILKPNGFGIGILNIHKRIQIAYGSEYGLFLHNEEDLENGEQFAIAELCLPYIQTRKENENVEIIDCR